MVVFEDYDTGSKKYLTANDLLRAYQKIYRETSNNAQAEAVIATFPNKKLTKEHFKAALEELDRRHCMEQSIYWDYQSLSRYSDREISPIEATTLCQLAHGDSFSPDEWEMFLANRVQGKSAPLSWNDLRVHLCTIPGKSGQKRTKPTLLSDAKKIKLQLEDDEIKRAQAKGKAQAEAQMENLQLEIEYENKRLKEIYKKYGAIAVIFDDGGDGSSFTAIPKKQVEPEPVYDLDWIRRQMSEEEWRKLSEKERQRLLMEAKLLERMLRREMYGEDWQRRLRELGDDEEARQRLLEEQRRKMERMLALRLLNKKKNEKEGDDVDDDIIFDVPVEWFDEGDENLAKIEEDYCVDWVKRQMDEEEWRKLSEQERQRLIALAKLEQRKLRREMYGDDWLRYLASLRDQEAIDEAKRRQKEEFDRLLKARLFRKGDKTEEELEKEVEELIEEELENKVEEEYDVDWVKRQLDEEEWRKLNERERNRIMTKHRVARLKVMKEMFGDDFKMRLKQLGDDEDARRRLMKEQRRLFEEKLAAKLKMKKPKKLEEVEDADISEKDLEKFSADWLLKQMGEDEWNKLSEQERQRMIALAKLEAKKAQKEFYGDEWLRRLKEIEGDENAMKKLRDEQRKAFNARLAAALLVAKKRPESPEKEPRSLLDVEDKIVDEEKMEEFSADWVQQQMSEAEWKKLSEQERQRLIAIAKLEQKKLQKEMYGDDYLKAMKSLEGDENAMKKLRDDQRNAFDARLAAALLAAKNRPKSPEPESLLEVQEKIVDDEKLEQFSADWVQQQMNETEWKQLSEQERQRLIAIAKLEQKKLQKEIYGDDYLKAMKLLEGDEEATKKLQEEQRKNFDTRLAAALAAARRPKVEKLDEIQEVAAEDLPPEKIEQFCADWVKDEMDAAEWKKLSEQERQKLIALAILEQKKLQKEIYGDDFTMKLKQLEGDEAAIQALREEKRSKFNALLAARVLKKEKPILVQVLDEKIRIVSQFGDEYKKQVASQAEIVKTLDENDEGVLFAATLNLLQVAIAIDGAETSAIDQIPLQGPTIESLKLVSRPKDEQKIGSIEKYTSFKGWDKLHPFFAKNLELINVYSLALQEAQFVYDDEKVKLGAQEFRNYPNFWLRSREYQIFHQFEEGKDDRFVKRSLREVIALKTVIDDDFSLEKFQVLLGRYFYRNLESPESVEKVIKEKNLRFMLGALLLDFTELFEKSPENRSLRKHIVEKYSSMRDRALMVIARGDPQQGLRPVSEARVEVDKMKKELEATFYERKAMAKYMKSRGFAYSSPPEKAFGPNLARSYDSVLTSTTVIKDEEIIPESDLSDTFDLYFVLYQYEQMEIAFNILHENKQNPSNEETLWQKNEKERLDLISEFIEAIHTSQLSVRSRQRAILDGKEIKQDRQRYIQLARLVLAQKESRKVLKDQSAPKDSNSSAWLSFGDNVILRMLQNAKAIVTKILNDSFQEELRDFCMLMPEADRAQEIIKTNEERAKIDPTHASAKIDNNSLIQKGLALVYANKMHLAIKLGASEMNSSDICAAILAELLEEFDNFRESEWKVHSKATALELEKRLNSEIEAGTSEEIWKLICGKTSVARAEVDAEHDEVVDKKRDDIIAAALLKSVGQQEWQRMSEKDRQMKILEMKRLQRQNEKESVGFSSKKLLEDFNGNEEAYRKYKESEKAKSYQALDAKIAALKAKKAAETDAKKQAEAEEEIEKLTTLKRSLSDLQKVELDADKEKLAIMAFLESSDGKMSQEKMRQMASLKLRMQKKQLANGEIEDTAIWIRSTDDKSAAGAAAEKQRQKELAKARLAALKAGRMQKSEEPVDQNASKEDQLAALLENMQKEELAVVYARIECKKYKSLGSDRIELLSKLDATDDVEKAIDIRLALIALTNEEPDVEIIRLLAEEQKKVSYEALNRDSRGDFEDLLEDVKMKSVRNVAFGVGSDEEVERELASKYRAVKRQASRNAIKEEISDAVWDELDEKEQEKLIDEIASSDDIDAAIKNHKRIAELSMKAKKEDLKTEAEKQESAKKRKNVLDDLSKNYDRELQGILAAADQQADRQKAEKARQLKIAMIRKERKQIEKENKTEEIGAFVREMTMASANTEKRVNDERKRQQERQKEKLAAMKRKRQTMTEKAKEEQIQQEIESFFDKNEIENNISDVDSFTEDTLFDQVLTAMTSLHSSEISALHTLMVTATDNKDALADAEAMDLKKLEKKLSGGSSSYFKRRLEYYNIHLDEPLPEHMIPSKQVEQKTLLTKAMILRFVKFNKERNISKTSESLDAYEEATIYLSSELTTRQALELKNFESMLEDIEDPVLKEVIKLLKRAKNEFWSPNITSVMFYPPMTKEDGPALAQAWINQAKKRCSGAAAGILIDQKISQKRKDDRATENILTRQHTIIQTNITPEEEKAMLEQFQQNMLKRQSTIVESRKSQMQKILERKSQLKEKQQERKAAEVEKALLAMDREKTMMINTRKSQSTGLENRLDTLRLERTMTQARKSQGGLNFANQANEGDDMEDLAQKLQATATIERQDTNELLLEINNSENATTPAEEETQGDSLTMMRERTMMRKSKKKAKE